MALVLFTAFYPYDFTTEYAFIAPEISRLAQNFERIIVVPRRRMGKTLPLPPNVELNNEYADFLKENAGPLKMMKMAVLSDCFFKEIRNHPTILIYPSKLLKLVLFSARVELTRQWMQNLIETQRIDMNNCILYSYWFDHAATSFTMIKQDFRRTKVVSRAHGYDIYEQYYYPYYWPCRRETLDGLDALFVASDAGRNYFAERYPEYASRIWTAHLGIENPGFITHPSTDGVFRVVTCSHIVPIKRLHLIADGIAAAAYLRPGQRFEWVHFGDGKGRASLHRRIIRKFPPNAQARLMGQVPNREVIRYYESHSVDVFVNASRSEGGAPVSIQEAISCGIPVIATAVGGNPEIVSERNGILLSSHPKPVELAVALLRIWDNPQLAAAMRLESRQIWQVSYNASHNFRTFAEQLKSIGER